MTVAALNAAVAAITATLAGVPSIGGADTATLAALAAQTATAQGLAQQVLANCDAFLTAAGAAENFASGTAPATMTANVGNLLLAHQAILAALDLANKLSRFAVNLAAIIAPSGELADLDHTFGGDLGVTASGDIAVVSGWLRTAQRVIRRLCTPTTKALAQTTMLAVSAGDDLFRLAAALYNDATAWSLLAAANGLADPLVQDDVVLAVPAYSAARVNDGILPVPGATS